MPTHLYYPRGWEVAADSSVTRYIEPLKLRVRQNGIDDYDEPHSADLGSQTSDVTTVIIMDTTKSVTSIVEVTATSSQSGGETSSSDLTATSGTDRPQSTSDAPSEASSSSHPVSSTAAPPASTTAAPTTSERTTSDRNRTASDQATSDRTTLARATSAHTTSDLTTAEPLITSFPSPSWTPPAHTTSGYSKCPDGYLFYHCGFPQAQFIFNGCCRADVNPCKLNGYCPRWAFAVMAGEPNAYHSLTLNDQWSGVRSEGVMTSTHIVSGSTTTKEAFTVKGPFAATTTPPPPATTTAAPADDSGISGGAIAGIVVGIVAAVLVLGGAGLFWWMRRRRQRVPAEDMIATPRHYDAGPANPQMAHMQYQAYDAIPQDGFSPLKGHFDTAAKSAMGPGYGDAEPIASPYEPPAELPGSSVMAPVELPANHLGASASSLRATSTNAGAEHH